MRCRAAGNEAERVSKPMAQSLPSQERRNGQRNVCYDVFKERKKLIIQRLDQNTNEDIRKQMGQLIVISFDLIWERLSMPKEGPRLWCLWVYVANGNYFGRCATIHQPHQSIIVLSYYSPNTRLVTRTLLSFCTYSYVQTKYT